ncbi:hypothetical protein LME02_04700 [Leuconostoc mesenteroides subsp. dextranicum]|nr:hypothetical protein LME02_04700 [Leuconostoc mesenteroides subsp. dextranicum]
MTGKLPKNTYAKDIIMGIIAKYGVSFGVGYAIEFYGETVENLSMEARMTMCNMSIEAGSRTGMVQPDQTIFDYIEGREQAPKDFESAKNYWSQFYTDDESDFDETLTFDVSNLKPMVTWGTNPGMATPVDQSLPAIKDDNDANAYEYIGLHPNMKPVDINLDYIFIGSCTNSRYEDLEIAANMMKGHHLAADFQTFFT